MVKKSTMIKALDMLPGPLYCFVRMGSNFTRPFLVHNDPHVGRSSMGELTEGDVIVYLEEQQWAPDHHIDHELCQCTIALKVVTRFGVGWIRIYAIEQRSTERLQPEFQLVVKSPKPRLLSQAT